MGIKERRRRQKEALRSGILAAAREIASVEGWRAVTIRKIAARIEYSPPVIYEYFDSKDEILLELMCMGYAQQLEAVERAVREADGPEEALVGIGRDWLGFAAMAPDLYQVMYGLGGVSFPVTELRKEGEKIGEAIARVIEEILKMHGREPEDVGGKVTLLWGTAHGLVSLAMAGRIVGGNAEVQRLMDQAVRDHLVAWLKG